MEDAPFDSQGRPADEANALRRAPPAATPAAKEHPSDIAAIEDDSDEPVSPELDPRRAYEVLEIRTPLEEFEGYVKARVDTLVRLGDSEKAELTAEAMELGRRALARVTGVSPQEKGARS